MLDQPVPDHLLDLLNKLDRQDEAGHVQGNGQHRGKGQHQEQDQDADCVRNKASAQPRAGSAGGRK